MGYKFPHTRNIMFALAGKFGTAYQRLEPGFTDNLETPEGEDVIRAALHVTRVGGRRVHVEQTERFRVDVYAWGTDPAFDVADAFIEFLEGRDHAIAGHDEWGSIDDVTIDQLPVEVPYPSDTISQVSTLLGLTTRAM